MPDGDIIHSALSRRYQKPYKQLCEWVLSPETLSRELAERVKQQMIDYHRDVAPFISAVTPRLEKIRIDSSSNNVIDWHAEHVALQNLACFSTGSKRAIGLAVQTGQAILNQIQNGCRPTDLLRTMYSDFARRIYNSEFGDAVPETSSHYTALNNVKVSADDVDSRLAEIEPLVVRHLDTLANKTAQHVDGTPLNLRLAPKKSEKIDDLDLDISALMDE